MQVLFGNPRHTQARISPDGKYLSYLAPDTSEKEVLNVWVKEIGVSACFVWLLGSDAFFAVALLGCRGRQ